MFHLVARSIDGSPLFGTWAEARRLWDVVLGATPDRVAMVLMPNHVHVLHAHDVRVPLAAALSGFARWSNHLHQASGPVFAGLPSAEPIEEGQKVRRHIRYVHLNPCRARLTGDPLTWPFSTHRDACGLAVPCVVPRAHEIKSFHAYVSSDPNAKVAGTALPELKSTAPDPTAVLHAVSAITRTPLSWFARQKSPARRLYLRAAVKLCPNVPRRDICELVELDRNAAARAGEVADSALDAVARAVGDTRFRPIHDRPLPWAPASWA
jgi:hypothetical protein